MYIDSAIDQTRNLLQQADAILVTAGAGMGADSGLPDFHGDENLWKLYPALDVESIKYPDIFSPRFFREDPYHAWAFFGHKYELYSQTAPHAGFSQLLDFLRQKPQGYFVYTSNIDGHFQKAGFAQARMVECHGSSRYFQCLDADCDTVWLDDNAFFAVDVSTMELLNDPPVCPECGAFSRPNILMFGDYSWNVTRLHQQQKNFQQWLDSLNSQHAALVVLEIGVGQIVPTVRKISADIILQYQARFIRINPDPHDCIGPDISIRMKAQKALDTLLGTTTNDMRRHATTYE